MPEYPGVEAVRIEFGGDTGPILAGRSIRSPDGFSDVCSPPPDEMVAVVSASRDGHCLVEQSMIYDLL
jgi:hypothetical protein